MRRLPGPFLPVAALLLACGAPPPALSPRPVAATPIETAPVDATATPVEDPFVTGAEDLGGVLAPLRERYGLPALAGAVVRGGRLVGIGAVGRRRTTSPETVTTGDLWHLGSCTKAMTATLVARLVERGVLGWNTTIAEVFGDVPMDPAWRNVTVAQLLTHRAGAPPNLDADGLWARLWNHRGAPIAQRRTLLEGVLRRPPVRPPGTGFLYSNAGYAIAGAMLERLTGTPWETLLRREVFEPLGMSSAGFGPPGDPATVSEPRGHRTENGRFVPVEPGPAADNPAAIGPGGTVHASMADWARFASLHLAGARGETDFLRPESFRRLHTPPAGQEYASGWVVVQRDWARGPALTHNGSNTMWFAVVWVGPNADIAVMTATNCAGEAAEKAADEAAWAIIRRTLSL